MGTARKPRFAIELHDGKVMIVDNEAKHPALRNKVILATLKDALEGVETCTRNALGISAPPVHMEDDGEDTDILDSVELSDIVRAYARERGEVTAPIEL